MSSNWVTRLRSECNVVTEPVSDAVPESLTVLKTALRVEHSADDTYLLQLMQEAAAQISERTGRQILTATRRLLLSDWWAGSLDLPFPRLQSVSSVKYLDTSEVEHTLDPSKYSVFTQGTYGRIVLKDSLPELSDEHEWPVYITYVCGYGVVDSAVPAGLKTPIRRLVKELYEKKDMSSFPKHVDALLDRWVLRKIR